MSDYTDLIPRYRDFVAPYYADRGAMFDLSHIDRVLTSLEGLTPRYAGQFDEEILILGAYSHGVVYKHEILISAWLETQGVPRDRVQRIALTAWESQVRADPKTLEGKLLHDAHLIEGGRTFLVVKPLVDGGTHGRSLEEMIAHIEKLAHNHLRCALPEAQRIYEEMKDFAATFVSELRASLGKPA